MACFQEDVNPEAEMLNREKMAGLFENFVNVEAAKNYLAGR